jgi:hypothetical protein
MEARWELGNLGGQKIEGFFVLQKKGGIWPF